jgi:hypothetical protein
MLAKPPCGQRPLRILYLNEIRPGDATASAAVLGRHMAWPGAQWTVYGEEHISVPKTLQRIRNRLVRPIAPKMAFRIEQNWESAYAISNLSKQLDGRDFDLVLTLAHGRLGLRAWHLAERLGLPLAIFFHDWWPELLESSSGKAELPMESVTKAFSDLQARSDVCLAVCEGMAEHLLPEARKTVIYPIPDPAIKFRERAMSPPAPLVVTYTGSLWSPYGGMVSRLADEIGESRDVKLKVYGERQYLEPEQRERMERRGQLYPFVPQEEFSRIITEKSDILLGVMGSDAPQRVRMRTSFPSKVANYFRTGNATLLWAPPDSALGRFAITNRLTLYQPALDPTFIMEQILELAANPGALVAAAKESQEIGSALFDPVRLNEQLYEQLRSTVERFRDGRPR